MDIVVLVVLVLLLAGIVAAAGFVVRSALSGPGRD